MKLLAQNPVAYLGEVEKTSKAGNKYTMLHFGDPLNYQQLEFFKRDELQMQGIEVGQNVLLEIELVRNGYNVNNNLVAVYDAI